jgi:hypothetical protein
LPLIATIVWEDLQTTEVEAAKVPPNSRQIKHYLMALHFVKRYRTELEREATWDISPSWGRDWCWFFVEKIQALKEEKIRWPIVETADCDDVLEMTVDGIHCWVQEPCSF